MKEIPRVFGFSGEGAYFIRPPHQGFRTASFLCCSSIAASRGTCGVWSLRACVCLRERERDGLVRSCSRLNILNDVSTPRYYCHRHCREHRGFMAFPSLFGDSFALLNAAADASDMNNRWKNLFPLPARAQGFPCNSVFVSSFSGVEILNPSSRFFFSLSCSRTRVCR